MAETEQTYMVAAATRARLTNATTALEVTITRAWVDAWDTLAPMVRASLADILARYVAGQTVPRSVLRKDKRLRAALAQVRSTLQYLADHASDTAGGAAQAVIVAAPADVEALIRTQLPAPGTPGVPDIPLPHPAPDALDAIVTRVQQQIHASTWPLAADTEAAMKRELVRNLAVGDGPRETARRIMQATQGRFEGGLGRALNISRTEVLDAYRAGSHAAHESMQDVLKGQRWTARLDARTCGSCLAHHGELYPPDDMGPIDHPSGRCTYTPVTKSWKDLGIDVDEPAPVYPDRDTWWDTLTDSTKRNILGPGRLELLDSGAISWADLSVLRHADGWRDSYVMPSVASLRELVASRT